jgi:hypothetical protein
MLSRRSLLSVLLGGALAVPLGMALPTDAEAQPGPGSRPDRPGRSWRRPPAPRPRFERRPAPRPGFVWVPGRWVWTARRGRWVWVPGRWRRRWRRR